MSYWGEMWSLICALFWASAVILFRIAVRGIPAIEMSIFKNAFALILFALTLAIVPAFDGQGSLPLKQVLWLMLSGCIGIAMGDTLFMYSLNILGAGRNAIISCLFSPFVMLLSFLFLNESFSIYQGLGFALILCGIILAVYQKPADALSNHDRFVGISVGVLSIFCMATGMVTTKPILTDASPVLVSCIRLSGGLLGVLIFAMTTGRIRKSILVFRGKLPWKFMFLGAFLGSYLALFAWIVGFKHTSASIASILNQTSVFFTLILAVPFLKERLSPMKTAGALLGFAGVTLILIYG
jgi:drug/metabolite transporter (DMT)-like permease